MARISLVGLVLLAGALQSGLAQAQSSHATASSNSKSPIGSSTLASRMGAALNSNLLLGGGTDDTSALQAGLDQAAGGKPVHLVIDGPALVSGLNLYGNTIVECTNGGGLYLKDGSSRAIIRNVHRSREATQDEHIAVIGCFLNGNRWKQPGAGVIELPEPTGACDACAWESNQESDGTYISGLQFLGVNYLTIENVTLWNVRAFGALIGNANRIDIRNVIVDDGALPEDTRDYGNTDGLHFAGPIRYLTIDGARLRTGDDAIALNADDSDTDDVTMHNENYFGPYVRQGPITDVLINNVQLMDTEWGIRLLSSKSRVDRVMINNVIGTVNGAYAVNMSHWLNPNSLGNFGSISISNLIVDRSNSELVTSKATQWSKISRQLSNDLSGGNLPLISINASIESLSLRNISTKASDARPILRLSSDANVKVLVADLTVYDPDLRGVPVELDQDGRIDELDLCIHWKGESTDQGKNAIASLGTIRRLNWVDTPPLYVGAELSNGNDLAVTFSQNVKAVDFKAGVTIKVNGKPVRVSVASRQDRSDIVHYLLKDPVGPADIVTWTYNAAEGSIQNWSAGQLLSVSGKRVKGEF